jgi:formylglycine-generating enzyme required for sulfatase activity
MATLRQLYIHTHQNLLTLQEREAKFAGDAPLRLLNQISDHEAALELLEPALNVQLTPPQFEALKAQLRPLLLADNVEQLNLDSLRQEKPRLPFEPDTIPIPAGSFWMGCDAGQPEESPRHQVNLPAYAIGKFPVTIAQYAEFINQVRQHPAPKKAGWFALQPPADKLDHPVVSVSWHDALAYCRWLSQRTGRAYRLPTEAEWEKAAAWTGAATRVYPWGDDFSADHCNAAETGRADTTAVGRYSPQGDSFYGCVDMAGNVQEWTNTLWGSELQQSDYPYPYQPHDGRENIETRQQLPRVYLIYRGGSFRDEAERLRCPARGHSDPDSKLRWRGFRVALEIV